MRAFTFWYSENKDEITLKKSKEFKNSICILRLDIMKDALYDLTQEYNKALDDFHNGKIEHEGCESGFTEDQAKSFIIT